MQKAKIGSKSPEIKFSLLVFPLAELFHCFLFSQAIIIKLLSSWIFLFQAVIGDVFLCGFELFVA